MTQWTVEKIEALSVQQRNDLYKNACRLGHTTQGAALKAIIEETGLPFSEEGMLASNDPITLTMRGVIFSKDGREACLAATKVGLPAMAGVDPMLQAALGVDYGPHNWGTIIAGSFVGELMQSLGYKKISRKPLPPHCVAKTAAMWA